EDQDILVVRKPAGLAVQTAKTGQQDVVSELKNYLRQPYLGIVHRLDQPVEGLLAFAKNRNAAAVLAAQLQGQGEGGALHKLYYAVLCGKPAEAAMEYVDYLYKDENHKAVIVENTGGPGKPSARRDSALPAAKRAALSCRVLQAIDCPAELALAEILLETGRFHQIRAQMAHHGYPLLGDVKYGDDSARSLSQRLGVRNVALCACRLELVHPGNGRRMCFRTEPQAQAFSYFDRVSP
ncbi:MAG: RluA family pseudouridine synthase, partial [Lachnospiraceae bacterium]|nr:RluA family pseudouridine synthase [Lachnospiraceae bacterium]